MFRLFSVYKYIDFLEFPSEFFIKVLDEERSPLFSHVIDITFPLNSSINHTFQFYLASRIPLFTNKIYLPTVIDRKVSTMSSLFKFTLQ